MGSAQGRTVIRINGLRGFHSVTLWLSEVEATARLLTEQLGYEFVGQEGPRSRYRAASRDVGLYVDLLHRPGPALNAESIDLARVAFPPDPTSAGLRVDQPVRI